MQLVDPPVFHALCIFFVLHSFSCCTAFAPFLLCRGSDNPLCETQSNTFSLSSYSSFEDLYREFNGCSGVPEIQKALVQKGIEFKERRQNHEKGSIDDDGDDTSSLESQSLLKISQLEKVPGCVANVYVQTILRRSPSSSSSSSDDKHDWDVSFEGTADAILSRGLLAVLTSALASLSPKDILEIDVYSVADQLAIRRALSPGRNDGLANMLQIIQQQIEGLILLREDTERNNQPRSIDTDATTLFVVDSSYNGQDGNPIQNDVDRLSPAINEIKYTPTKGMPTVALLLSGGVDSSVALRLLLREGYDVTAFYLKIWLEDELAHLGQCPWEDDYNVCKEVCKQAGVPLESLSLQKEYKDRVISYTTYEAQRGRTPNPDIMCNSRVKFGCFYDAIADRPFDYVASGHYASLQPSLEERVNLHSDSSSSSKSVRLFRAPDPVKDQSYFLCALTQEQLKRVIFPIGHLEKAQVRALAEEFELPNRRRPDSQGLCFLGKVKFEEFLGAYLGERPGDIVDAKTGDILGRHRGVWYHTVGQRKGIGKVLDPFATSRGPWYVVAKDPDRNLVFCSNEYDEDIFTAARSEFHVEDIQWIAGEVPSGMKNDDQSARFDMKIRHGPKIVGGILSLTSSDGRAGTVKLDNKDGGLAPGQYVVFYEGEECLGGGVISERHWARFLEQHKRSASLNVSTVST